MTVRVLIVDDSRTACAALRAAFGTDPEFDVIAEAHGSREAVELVEAERPDLVTMDLFLPGSDGIDATATIMSSFPTRVVIVTAANAADPDLIYRAMQVGALEVWPKPAAPDSPGYGRSVAAFLRALRALARVPVVRHSFRRPAAAPGAPAPLSEPPEAPRPPDPSGRKRWEALLIGASTGGPPVIEAILAGLERPFPLPVVVVQHITPGFVGGFAAWLNESSGHRVEIVSETRPLEPGVVYVAGDGVHTVLRSRREIGVSGEAPRGFHRPSVDVLFESAAQRLGGGCAAALLTGMGADGARGLLELRNAGAFTIAQDPATCVVEGMPGKAIGLRAAARVLAPDQIPAALRKRMREP